MIASSIAMAMVAFQPESCVTRNANSSLSLSAFNVLIVCRFFIIFPCMAILPILSYSNVTSNVAAGLISNMFGHLVRPLSVRPLSVWLACLGLLAWISLVPTVIAADDVGPIGPSSVEHGPINDRSLEARLVPEADDEPEDLIIRNKLRMTLSASYAAVEHLAYAIVPGLRMRVTAFELTKRPEPYADVRFGEPKPRNVMNDAKREYSAHLSASSSVTCGFAASDELPIVVLSSTHARLTFAPFEDWFMVRVHTTPGTRLRIDLDAVKEGSWSSVMPVIADGSDPSDPRLFAIEQTTDRRLRPASATYARLPNTDGQAWRWADRVWMEPLSASEAERPGSRQRFCIEHTFSATTSLLAMRYPYTAGWLSHSLDRWKSLALGSSASVSVIELGLTRRGRRMGAVIIGEPGWHHDRRRPFAVIYGREHGTEPDASWAVHGAIEFLASDRPEARETRRRMTTFLMPCMDPDAADAPCYENLLPYFGNCSNETQRIAAPFMDLVNLGFPIDAVIDLHNIQGGQADWHGFSVIADLIPQRRAAQEDWLVGYLKPGFAERGFALKKTLGADGTADFRLAGHLCRVYGANLFAAELNVHSRKRHLRLDETQELGERLVIATAQWLSRSASAAAARRWADRLRIARAKTFAMTPRLMQFEVSDRRLTIPGKYSGPISTESDAQELKVDDPRSDDRIDTPLSRFLAENPGL